MYPLLRRRQAGEDIDVVESGASSLARAAASLRAGGIIVFAVFLIVVVCLGL